MKDNWTFYVQIALKSGKFAYGSKLIPAIQSRDAHLVLFEDTCGSNRRKKLIDKCTFYNIPYLEVPDEMLSSLSRLQLNSIAILDEGLAKSIWNEGKEW